jgi:hypothetical protein
MSRVLAAACFIGVLVMSMATLRAYGGTGDWKRRLSYAPAHEDDAYLFVLDRDGIVRWLHHGGFDPARADDLGGLLTSLADGRTTVADYDLADRRSER